MQCCWSNTSQIADRRNIGALTSGSRPSSNSASQLAFRRYCWAGDPSPAVFLNFSTGLRTTSGRQPGRARNRCALALLTSTL